MSHLRKFRTIPVSLAAPAVVVIIGLLTRTNGGVHGVNQNQGGNEMIVQCPHCGKPVPVNGLGRKRLDIPLKNVLESLQAYRDVTAAARELGCSPSYIFGVLKKNGSKLNDVIRRDEHCVALRALPSRTLGEVII